jgi:hypothetical protein
MFVAKSPRPQNKVVTVPAPIGGLNARDSLAAMPETDAIILNNWWPQPYGCSVRKGYQEFALGMPGEVASLAGWSSILNTQKLFAWSGANMYDITAGGTVGAAIVTGLSNANWQTTSMTNAAGAHLIAVNGSDNGIIYNSSGVARLVAGDGIVPNTWNGINPQAAIQLAVHQGRLWAVQKNTSKGWYLPVGQVMGIFVSFDFGPMFSRGGFLQYLFTWTIDDGNGAEDHLVAMSSEGEIVVYGGTNPNDPDAWALVGVYYAGAPVAGYRSFTKLAGDMAMITQRGVVSLSALLASTKVNQGETIIRSSKIQFLVSDATTNYGALPGWQLTYAAPYNMLLLNVPVVTSGGNFQFAANELMPSEPWTQFSNMDASCWLVHDNLLYYGDYDGRVLQAWVGEEDNVKLPVLLDTNPEFTTDIVGWTPNAGSSNTWVAGVNRAACTVAASNIRTLQTIVGDFSGKILRLTATYRNVSAASGSMVRVVESGTAIPQATLPTNVGTSFVTRSIDFLCTVPVIRIQGGSPGAENIGATVEFDSIFLTIAPIGTEVVVQAQQAYSYLGALSVQKQVGMYRPNFIVSEPFDYGSAILYDFVAGELEAPPPPSALPAGALWGTALWGSGLWGGTLATDREWNQAEGVGVAASFLMAAQTSGEVIWVSTDYSYKVGGLF